MSHVRRHGGHSRGRGPHTGQSRECALVSRSWPVNVIGRLVQLTLGLLIASAGIWLSIRANLGVASWEVLHIALADRLGIGVGTASIGVGALLVTIVAIL